MWIEIFGTTMSVVIAVSLMQKNIRWLRIINAIGAVGFAIYGLLINAWPVLILNSFIFVVDIYYLGKLRNIDDVFDFLAVDGLKSLYVQKFVDFHLEDIHHFIPEFNPDDRENVRGCLILRNMRPVSILLYRPTDASSGEILLDYSIDSYRDYRNARFFLDYVVKHLDIDDISSFTAVGSTAAHIRYLEHLGFERISTGDGVRNYRKSIQG